MKSRKLKLLTVLLSVICIFGLMATTAFALNSVPSSTNSNNEENYGTLTNSGTCGTSATWEYYEESGTLIIGGSGTLSASSAWSSFKSKVFKVIVADEITNITQGTFGGFSNLKEITLPFVGASRTATAYESTFGHIFGYTTLNAYASDRIYKGIFEGGSDTCVGYVQQTGKTDYSYYGYTSLGNVTYSTLGWTSKYGYASGAYSNNVPYTEYIDYKVGSNTGSTTCKTFKAPSYSTWQYSCNNYHYGDSSNIKLFTLQSYYYEIPESIAKVTITDATHIPAYAFMNCENIKEINLNDEITSIGEKAFKNCTSLDVFELPNDLVELEEEAFYNCSSLESIEFPQGITSIPSCLFYGCTSLKAVDFNDEITVIDNSAFYNCNSLRNIVLPEKLITIGSSAFYNCASFTDIIIPNSVTVIGASAFSGCTNVTTLNFGKSVTEIGAYSFSNLHNLQQLIVPDNVQLIENSAFYGCGALVDVTLPFVGRSRDATSYKATFGYIFGYTTLNAYSSNNYKGIFSGDSTKCVGYVYQTDNTEYSYYGYKSEDNPLGTVTYSMLGWTSKLGFTTYENTSFVDYKIGNNTSYNYYTYVAPTGSTWQYSCNNYSFGTNRYTLQSYYYHIPAAISKVTITDATHIQTAAFLNCANIKELYINAGLNSIGECTFRNVGTSVSEDELLRPNNESDSYDYSYTNGSDTYYYTVDDSGNATIVKCSTTSTQITLPTSLGGYTVTTIGKAAFKNCTSLNGVTIPNTITKISDSAFEGCRNLVVVTIPATCVFVGEYAFSGCSSLETVTIAEGVEHIGNYCFENCVALSKIVIPDSCTYLGKYAFYNCSAMVSATIGISVPVIGDYTFYNCESLATIVIGIKVESIGDYAFYNTGLTKVATPALLASIGDYAFADCSALTQLALKGGLITIGEGAFKNDSLLSTLTLPANVNDIGAYAFYGCSSIASISIPAGVSEIKDYAFAYCSSLSNITFKGTITSIGTSAFYCDALASVTLSEGLESIGANAFAYNNLATVYLPSSLTYLGEQAFYECALLETVSIPDSADVGGYAFSKNTNDLTITIRYNKGTISDYMLYNSDVYKVVIENGIVEIGDYVFALCHELAEITLPDTLRHIGNYAFYDNRMYSEITLPCDVESIGDYAFARGYRLVKINVSDRIRSFGINALIRSEAQNHIDPDFTVSFYYDGGYIEDELLDWQEGIHHIIVADNIHTIGNNAFSQCFDLVDIVLPDTITSFGDNCFLNDNSIVLKISYVDGYIDDEVYKGKLSGVETIEFTGNDLWVGKSAFADNTSIKYVSFKGGIIFFEDYAFSNNIGILEVNVNGATSIGNYSFYNCNSMTSFVIDGLTGNMGEHAFDSCKSLKTFTIPQNTYYIGAYAFYDCNSLTTINIPNLVENILPYTFYGCASLSSIELPNGSKSIGDYAFYGCVALTNITIPNQCETIGEAAFYNCSALTELVIPDSVTSIGAYAFRSCGGISELVFSDNVEEIGACAFYDCNGLKTVKLGKRIIELSDRLFYGCVNLESLYIYAPLSYIDAMAFYGADFVTVYCGQDDYMINFFEENYINYVILDDLVYEYKITFVYDNGEIISSDTYTSGSTVIVPNNPTKAADNTYTYVFAGWDQEVTTVGGHKTYTAEFTPVYIEYTVVFKDYNGDIISTNSYHYLEFITIPADPTRASDNTYSYTFTGWDSRVLDPCHGDAVYTATYEANFIEYTIEFKDYNGDVISSNTYHYGDTVAVPSNPTRDADHVGTYSFKGWDKSVIVCTGDATYIATYDIDYTDYTVVFKDYDGNTISSNVYHYGDTVTVPSNPMRASDNTYTYDFAGWDTSVVTSCNGDATYTATYIPTFIEYTVEFYDYDNSWLATMYYHYGDIVFRPMDPTRDADETYTYTFAGWDKPVVNCVGNATYTATYAATYIDYTVVFKNYDGKVISTNTYHYGDTVNVPNVPTRESDVIGSYTFKAWDQEVVNCVGNATYIATYNVAYTDYTVIFKNYNGDVLSTNTYHYGDTIVIPSAPSKPADETYTYAFIGWDKTVTTCEGNATYTAEFVSTNVEYTVVFKNENGMVISTNTYYYGQEIVVPQTPTKAADNTYTYSFAGWDKEVVDCVADATYTATYTPIYIDYTITFFDYDGTIIKTVNYHYGDTIEIAEPTREADNTFTYTFAGWDNELGICTGNDFYTALYDATYIDYIVIFKDEDGSVISSLPYHYGDPISVPRNPTKASDNTYTYTFAGWDKTIVDCAGDAIYTATYNSTYIDYTVIFKNEDGTVLSTKTYHYGDDVAVPTTPTKVSDNTYTYTFKAWDKEVVNCAGDATYTATYDSTYIDYTVIFKNEDGTALSTNIYHYGDEVVAPTTPTKAADNTYTYTFAGWDKEVVACTGDAIYTATYNSTYIDYTVIFKNEDGTVLSTNTYRYGDEVVAPITPTKAADNTYIYTFAGWDKNVTNCDGNATYKATYNATFINYTVVFKNYNDDVISSKTYHYGDTVVVPSTPKKPSDENYCYVFAGWDKSVTNCYGDAVYTAKFTASDLPIVTVNGSSARASETVVVNILLSGAPNLESLAISDILYDTNAFELVSVEWKVTDAILSNWDAATGKGALALSTSKDLNGTIISLTFKVKDGTADGNYSVSCTVTSHESDFKNVAGQITVYSVAPGDVDGNESIDKNDAIYLLMHSFFPEDYPINQEADYNGDGEVNKDDAIHLLMYTFFPDDYPLALAPAATTTVVTTEERKKEDEE